jgi:sarcosine oxidase subunit alpha
VTSYRLPEGGSAIDRSKPLSFVFDDVEYPAFEGDTLASALLANGINGGFRSPILGRPRGVMTAGPSEPNAFVEVSRPWFDAIAPATMVKVVDGLAVRSLRGVARLPAAAPADRDVLHRHAHVETLFVGTSIEAVETLSPRLGTGDRVLALAGDGRGVLLAPGEPGEEERSFDRMSLLGLYDDGYAILLEHADPADCMWHVRAKRVVLATAPFERSIAFESNDRPGVMLAASVQRFLETFGVLAGRRAVVFTTHDGPARLVDALAGIGAEIAAVLDVREGVAVESTEAGDDGSISAVRTTDGRRIECDLLCVSGGWNPDLHLWRSIGGTVRYDATRACFVPDQGPGWLTVTVQATGAGLPETAPYFAVPTGDRSEQFVDLQRDQTVADIEAAVEAGLRNVEHVKRATYIGTAVDQGRTSGVLTAEIVNTLLGAGPGDQGPTTARPPSLPVSFAALSGPYRGELFDPIRTTPIHSWHVHHGAVFENVGQWKRPWYFPATAAEEMENAVLRECAAARTGVAMMDASTLGKIEVVGPDAPAFLDRMYTNAMSTLAVGRIRYGLMLGLDGMAFDDGVAMRLAEDRYLVTTTTGGAARVLDRFEEWLQTEWPDLRVYCTSVTEQWATIAVVGPRTRELIRAAGTDVDVSNEAMPFMTWRDGHVAGVSARLARVSFSGELAIEVNVAGTDGLQAWEALFDAGEAFGITPYGTEAMHVLRAEKGFVIVGQDTDGTQTPDDLGMSWIVNTKKGDFIGRRSLRRSDTLRPDRKHLVGLLPTDPEALITEGAQLVEAADAEARPPVPAVGYVTSSYRSAALRRTFALAQLTAGRARFGETVVARSVTHDPIPATVTEPTFYDPEGTSRDG